MQEADKRMHPSEQSKSLHRLHSFTDTSCVNSTRRTEDVSYPTQVSEHNASNADEVLFSSGRSIRVQNRLLNTTAAKNNQTPDTRNDFSRTQRFQKHHQNNLRNDAQEQHVERLVLKRPPKQPRHPEYIDFSQRLRSFARWWKQFLSPTELAEAGFFYTNKEDLVRCYHCGIGLKDFSPGDNPLKEHVKHSADCPHLKDYLDPESLENIKRQVLTSELRQNNDKQPEHGATNCPHPEYKSYETRLSSFSGWPRNLLQTPVQLAEAGFYYTGFADNVRCFACSGGLRQWEAEDDPWLEHCRLFPECPIVKQRNGQRDIAYVHTPSVSEDRQAKRLQTNHNIPENDMTKGMESLSLKDPELNAVISEHRMTCLEMGYLEKDFNNAMCSLAKAGKVRLTIEDIVDAIEAENQNKTPEAPHQNETPAEENTRLRSLIFCVKCETNAADALFLPCTHHKLCLNCVRPLTRCPLCDKFIK